MEERYIVEDVRYRLILAGLGELCEHGIRDFSLRRVALAAQVSCAAPYRHFKDKDELIAAIVEYIASKWLLLSHEIKRAFAQDPERLAVELSVSAVRFWVANGNFRTVLMTDGAVSARVLASMESFDKDVLDAISALPSAENSSREVLVRIKNAVRSIIYGTVMLIGTGRLENTEQTVSSLKKTVRDTLRSLEQS